MEHLAFRDLMNSPVAVRMTEGITKILEGCPQGVIFNEEPTWHWVSMTAPSVAYCEMTADTVGSGDRITNILAVTKHVPAREQDQLRKWVNEFPGTIVVRSLSEIR